MDAVPPSGTQRKKTRITLTRQTTNDKHEAEVFSALYGVANGVWTNVIEQIVIEVTDRNQR